MAGRGWMNNRPRMGLTDAYEIASPTDYEPEYRPRTAPETPQIIKDWFARAESEERSIFRADTQQIPQPERNLTGSTWSVSPRDPSPSPAAKLPATQHIPQPERDLTGSTWSVSPRDPSPNLAAGHPTTTYEDMRARAESRPVVLPGVPSTYEERIVLPAVSSTYEERRVLPRVSSTYEERRALLKRIANNPRPAFKPYVKPKSIFERYRRDNPLQPIAPLEPEPEPLEHIPQDQGLFTPPSSQEQSPEKTWNDGFDFTAGNSILVSNSPVLQVRKIDEIREIEEQLKREELEKPEREEMEIKEPEEREEELEEPEQKGEEMEEPEKEDEKVEELEDKDEMRDILRRLSRVSMSPAPERTAEDPEDRITAEAKLFEPAEKSGPPSDDDEDDNEEEPTNEGHSKPTLTTAAEDLRDLQIEAGIEDSTTVDEPKTERPLDNYDIFLARMEQRLRNTSTSLRDTRHGIERLEKEVSSRDSMEVDGGGECIHIHIKFPIPKWKAESPRVIGTLGWLFLMMLVLFATWYVAESVTCYLYCKPIYSSYGGWSPSDPVFPWALPTKLYQLLGDIVIGV
ncbi:uncharacterized protein PAC_11902 [Phialocephala subalpina]|uniref:Uncharacterized protein n=1 Tax=Phialocephala subalpina TaxID=576137 RepID=A0A1L7XAG0_9HELO|nr:uncharacterized protein PAC_11902 [Phialocephala subalpina]